MNNINSSVDLERLLKLRLIVARFGEMDSARWWNTNGILGRKGTILLSRGFPKTHLFTQARIVFEVARARSAERFPAVPGCVTLWRLPARLEDEFDAKWSEWLESDEWPVFIEKLQSAKEDLITMLLDRNLISKEQQSEVERMRSSTEGRSIPLSGYRRMNDDTITLLAAGFTKGEIGKPAIPYARVED